MYVAMAAVVPPGGRAEDSTLGLSVMREHHPNHTWATEVQAVDIPKKRPLVPLIATHTEDSIARLLHDNLAVDLEPWRLRRGNITVSALMAYAKRLPPRNSWRIMMIKGGRVSYLMQKSWTLECEKPCDPVMEQLLIGELGPYVCSRHGLCVTCLLGN